jgi:hypothetical protein
MALWPGVRLTLQRMLAAAIAWWARSISSPTLGPPMLELAERDLYKPGVMAVSVEARRASAPGEATNLFVIRERRAHD